MSIFAMNEVISMPDLRPTLKLVLLMIANAYNKDTHKCHPSQERLANECGVSVQTIQRNVAELERRGLIQRHTRHLGRGQGSYTRYELKFLVGSAMPCRSPDANRKTSGSRPSPGNMGPRVRQDSNDQKTTHHERIDLLRAMAGNRDNQKNKTETREHSTNDGPPSEIELLAESLIARIDHQITLRNQGLKIRRAALRQLIGEVTWADQETLFVSWSMPLDRAKTDLSRELRLAAVSLRLDCDRKHTSLP